MKVDTWMNSIDEALSALKTHGESNFKRQHTMQGKQSQEDQQLSCKIAKET